MRSRSVEAGDLSTPVEVQDGHRRIRVQWANVEPLSAYQRRLEPAASLEADTRIRLRVSDGAVTVGLILVEGTAHAYVRDRAVWRVLAVEEERGDALFLLCRRSV